MSVKPDLLVIGCDPVGFEIAFSAAGLGATIVLIGQDRPPEPAYRARLAAVGATIIDGSARLVDGRHVTVGDHRWAPRWIVLANGATRPDPGLQAGTGPVTLVLGDDCEACTAALAASDAGSRVVLACPGPFLGRFHRDSVAWLRLDLERRGIVILDECGRVLETAEGPERIRFEGGHSLPATEIGPVVNCLPRKARLEGLDVGKATGGALVPDRGLRLGRSRVFLVGEAIADQDGMPPARNQTGLVLGQALFGKRDRTEARFDLRHVPTRPGLAEFGLTPDRLPEAERNRYRILRATRASANPAAKAALTVVTDRRSRVVGAAAFGHHASELVTPLLLLAQQGDPVTALAAFGFSPAGDDDLLAQVARQPLADLVKSPAAKRLMRLRRVFG
ncbi:hypothetical protein [Rhabdaerophilum sp. SD176]|uniref:hypothetical protein n=1 Tax=Rhabdaerophilum sp. SD176 TaxID=2983548 RepID=UPI0024E01C83|nr:hypothetical protein [Rhabdaerophilum sp. SD176]